MPHRYELEKELNMLHRHLVKMGALIEESIEDTIRALKKQDINLAKKVIKNDDKIDKWEQKIEHECINIIAMQSPMAKDLREITSVLKMITDLERIADHCADISEYTIKLANQEYIKPLVDIPLMVAKVREMLKLVIDSYVERDPNKALLVCKSDDIIDQYFNDIVLELQGIMEKESNKVAQCINLILIVKYIERMADHTTNIGEWIIYNITGNHEIYN